MSSGSDALSQEIRDAIRAKHRLVEKMKESVVAVSYTHLTLPTILRV